MYRVALHQSVVPPLDPVGLVDVAHRAGLDSVGLHVAATATAEQWWSRGIGSPMLGALVDALLDTRVTVLDVGRVPLGPELCVVDIGHPYGRVLDLGSRLRAQFVTARAGAAGDEPAEFFARLADLAQRYQLRPLLAPTPGTAVADLEQAVAVVDGTGGGVVLDVVPGRDDADAVDRTVLELGSRLGYVRVPAHELEHNPSPGLLATLPPHVPVAIGTTLAGDDAVPAATDHVARATALRSAVEALVRHPRARAGSGR